MSMAFQIFHSSSIGIRNEFELWFIWKKLKSVVWTRSGNENMGRSTCRKLWFHYWAVNRPLFTSNVALSVQELVSKLLSNAITHVSTDATARKINSYTTENAFHRKNVLAIHTVKNTSLVKLFKKSATLVYVRLKHGLAQKKSAKLFVKWLVSITSLLLTQPNSILLELVHTHWSSHCWKRTGQSSSSSASANNMSNYFAKSPSKSR